MGNLIVEKDKAAFFNWMLETQPSFLIPIEDLIRIGSTHTLGQVSPEKTPAQLSRWKAFADDIIRAARQALRKDRTVDVEAHLFAARLTQVGYRSSRGAICPGVGRRSGDDPLCSVSEAVREFRLMRGEVSSVSTADIASALVALELAAMAAERHSHRADDMGSIIARDIRALAAQNARWETEIKEKSDAKI